MQKGTLPNASNSTRLAIHTCSAAANEAERSQFHDGASNEWIVGRETRSTRQRRQRSSRYKGVSWWPRVYKKQEVVPGSWEAYVHQRWGCNTASHSVQVSVPCDTDALFGQLRTCLTGAATHFRGLPACKCRYLAGPRCTVRSKDAPGFSREADQNICAWWCRLPGLRELVWDCSKMS